MPRPPGRPGENWRRRIAAEERERQRTMFRPDVKLNPARVEDRRGLPPKVQKPESLVATRVENFIRNMGDWIVPPQEKHRRGLEQLRAMGPKARLQQRSRNRPGR